MCIVLKLIHVHSYVSLELIVAPDMCLLGGCPWGVSGDWCTKEKWHTYAVPVWPWVMASAGSGLPSTHNVHSSIFAWYCISFITNKSLNEVRVRSLSLMTYTMTAARKGPPGIALRSAE